MRKSCKNRKSILESLGLNKEIAISQISQGMYEYLWACDDRYLKDPFSKSSSPGPAPWFELFKSNVNELKLDDDALLKMFEKMEQVVRGLDNSMFIGVQQAILSNAWLEKRESWAKEISGFSDKFSLPKANYYKSCWRLDPGYLNGVWFDEFFVCGYRKNTKLAVEIFKDLESLAGKKKMPSNAMIRYLNREWAKKWPETAWGLTEKYMQGAWFESFLEFVEDNKLGSKSITDLLKKIRTAVEGESHNPKEYISDQKMYDALLLKWKNNKDQWLNEVKPKSDQKKAD